MNDRRSSGLPQRGSDGRSDVPSPSGRSGREARAGDQRDPARSDLVAGSVFSGVGGLDLGLHQAGWRHAFFAESDSYRRDVLAARWPGVPIYDDVRDVGVGTEPGRNGLPVTRGDADAPVKRGEPVVDLLCGGFPCQDLSVAGQRRGLAGERSGLFFEFARIADALRPRWLLVENVPGLLSSNGGRDFGVVVGTLADIGYGVAWRVVDSRFFGVPQRRRRVFIVGALADTDSRAAAERAGEVLAVGTRCDRHPATRTEAREDVALALAGRSSGGGRLGDGTTDNFVTNPPLAKHGYRANANDETLVTEHYYIEDFEDGTLTSSMGRIDRHPMIAATLQSGRGSERLDVDSAESLVPAASAVRRLTPAECERLQGFPDGWTDLGGTPDSRRYAALGDAVTVNVAHWIGQRMIAA